MGVPQQTFAGSSAFPHTLVNFLSDYQGAWHLASGKSSAARSTRDNDFRVKHELATPTTMIMRLDVFMDVVAFINEGICRRHLCRRELSAWEY